jgi:hypothetical protein
MADGIHGRDGNVLPLVAWREMAPQFNNKVPQVHKNAANFQWTVEILAAENNIIHNLGNSRFFWGWKLQRSLEHVQNRLLLWHKQVMI